MFWRIKVLWLLGVIIPSTSQKSMCVKAGLAETAGGERYL